MEPVADQAATNKRKSRIERVSIGKAESERLEAWLMQIADSRGFLSITKTDLINFLIREHQDQLSVKELSRIHNHHYDPIRHMNWITQSLKKALSAGDASAVSKLQTEIKAIELSIVANSVGEPSQPSKAIIKKRIRKRKPSDATDANLGECSGERQSASDIDFSRGVNENEKK